MPRTYLFAGLASALLAAAHADGPDMPAYSFAGFGTLGVTHSSEHEADFSSTILKPTGAGFSRNWSADIDSRLGVQGSWNVAPQ
jgi:hypothetical protein